MEIVAEEFRDVIGFEGQYQISNTGIAKSLPRRVPRPSGWMKSAGRTLARSVGSHGYEAVSIGGEKRTIHSLVAAAFIGPRPEGNEINHRDGNKRNNKVGNLEYVTSGENNRHAYAMGLKTPSLCNGEDNHLSRLENSDVIAIRGRHSSGESLAELSRAFGVTIQNIWYIVHRITWKHI